jgi:hypothetical protein
MNGQISNELKKKPFRNWSTRTRVRPGSLRITHATPSERLEIEEIASRIKFGRF